jgi:selenocysteine-specific elongation factor
MKSIIVGTAGHIDHGKTALVKALTGIDADRLEEEKRRGITIDLGFAHMDLPAPGGETLRLGFVDVPGHERFVRNMLAGIGGIDLVLLVIAADEGIKPQTREHLDILQLLGVKRGITVLTKSDAIDPETLEVALLETEEFLRGTFLGKPNPIVAVSSLTGAGLEDLKRALAAAAAKAPARDSEAIPRLPIDRAFTMKGFGTVVTGTLVAGTIHREDELEILPTRKSVRVRGVQVHGSLVEQAIAGQRTALNLSGASLEDLSRGMTLVPSGTFETTRLVDVKLHLLSSAPRRLKNRARVHFHSYTMETVAEILLDGKGTSDESDKNLNTEPPQFRPGGERFVRLRLPEPSLLLPGDRFIIRQFSPVVTIGGGVVLDAAPIPRMPGRSDFLKILDGGRDQEILVARIARRLANGITIPELVAETGWTRKSIEARLIEAPLREHILAVGERLVHRPAIYDLQLFMLSTVEAFHKNNPLVGGIGKEQLREKVAARADVFDAVIASLDKRLEQSGELLRLPGHGVAMKDEEAESKKKIEDAFASAGLQVPALNEVLSGLKIDRSRAQKIVTLLLRDKVLIKISDELVFHRDALFDLRQKLAAYKAKSVKIDVAGFKELTNVTRKYAIPLLEYFDRERVTKRVGDARQIL